MVTEGTATASDLRGVKNRRTYLVVLALACATVIVGLTVWVRQLSTPLFGEGLVTWGLNIDVFFLTAGIGAALMMLVGLSLCTSALDIVRDNARRLFAIAVGCLVTACLVVLLDAGMPLRVFQMIYHPQFNSLFVWDFYFITLSVLLAVAGVTGVTMKGALGRVLAIVGIAAGLAVLIVEGSVLAVCTGTPLWHDNIALPVLFVAEGLVAAIAIVLLTCKDAVNSKMLVVSAIVLMAVVAVVNVVEVIVASYLGNGMEAETARVMVSGSLAPLFWLQMVVGVAIPVALLAMHLGKSRADCGDGKTWALPAIAAGCMLAGVFMGKLLTLLAGQAVLATGELSQYFPSGSEFVACIGYLGLIVAVTAAIWLVIDMREERETPAIC